MERPAPTRVLLVEDDAGDADLFRRALFVAGVGRFEVEVVSRLSIAVQRASEGSTDVVVLDLSLPDSFGIETLQSMRRAAPSTPIVVLTGDDDELVGLDALNEGAEDYLVKGDSTGPTVARTLLFAIERRLLHGQLNRRDDLLAEAQKIAKLGSFDWDVAADHVTCSDELLCIFGVERGEISLTYQGLLDRVRVEDRDRVHHLLQHALHAQQSFDFEFRIVRSEDTRVLHSRGYVVVAGAGLARRMAGTCQDITDRRKIEETLLLASRMTSVGTLASGVAHEINNPLSYVISGLEFLGQEIQELAKVSTSSRLAEMTETVDHARQGAERVRLIVKGLKTFSRVDVEERRRPVALETVLDLAINLAFNEIRHRAHLVKDYGRSPYVDADEARLSQVFVNLLLNAAQAIGDGHADENEIRVVTSTDSAGRAVVEIHDTGSGVLEANRSQIFDPFFTTKPVGLATGLGLSIVHGIVTGHGGEVTFEGRTGGVGTTFRVVLPAGAPDASPTRPPDRPPVHAATGRRGRVLIVDDEPMVATALSRILSRDHEVVTACNGREAMSRFEKGERFDVVLSDLMMPVMSGMDLFEELSKKIPDQVDKLIFLSGGAFTPAAKSFLDRVPNRRIEKPFESTGLRALVRSLVGG